MHQPQRASVLDDMFSDVEGEPAAQAERLELYKSALAESARLTDTGQVRFDMATKTLQRSPLGLSEVQEKWQTIEKALSGASGGQAPATDMALQLAEVREWIQKDWTATVPVSTGLMPYDLKDAAIQLWPRDTPMRNSTPREQGQGNAHQFKRILSITNAGVPGGAADALPFFSSTTTTSNWGSAPVVLNRPPKITYTGDDKTVPYMELGVSDSVAFIAQFKGIGFDDLRALSRTAALWAHLLGEEKADLYGRGTATGYLGAVSAPGSITLGTATTGGTIPAATYFVYVAAYTGTGYSAVSTVASQATTGATSTLTVTVGTEPTGALAYGLWIGTTTGIANAKFQGIFPGTPIVLTSYNASGAVTTGTDTSALSTGYDGFLTLAADPSTTGYLKRVNAAWSSTKPGDEIDTALTAMYVNNGANPDQVWMDGASRQKLGTLMRAGSNANGYRTNVVTGNTGTVMSTTVVGFANGNTGKVLDLFTHRFMPVGNAFIRSLSVPIPDSGISAPSVKRNVQDYMALDWPLLQMSYDISTYQIGTLVHYAPAWNGLLTGIQ